MRNRSLIRFCIECFFRISVNLFFKCPVVQPTRQVDFRYNFRADSCKKEPSSPTKFIAFVNSNVLSHVWWFLCLNWLSLNCLKIAGETLPDTRRTVFPTLLHLIVGELQISIYLQLQVNALSGESSVPMSGGNNDNFP